MMRDKNTCIGSDGSLCGGKWFEAFLRAIHRDIYNNIDLSDSSVLLQKNYMKSEEHNRWKQNIGKIQIPSCQDGFDKILEWFGMDIASTKQKHGDTKGGGYGQDGQDTYWYKVTEVVSSRKGCNIAVVCYMSLAHDQKVAQKA
jgi:hypothetical protein